MFKYYIGAGFLGDDAMNYMAFCASNDTDANNTAKNIWGKNPYSFSERPKPTWEVMEPVCDPDLKFGLSGKRHFFGGGELYCNYRGDEYKVKPTIYGEDRPMTVDGRAFYAIGEAEFMERKTRKTRIVYLDTLDEQHLMDHLDGAMIEIDFEFKNGMIA